MPGLIFFDDFELNNKRRRHWRIQEGAEGASALSAPPLDSLVTGADIQKLAAVYCTMTCIPPEYRIPTDVVINIFHSSRI